MVKSGETGGVLDAVLMRLADTIEKQVELRRKIKSAMTYPIVVLAICLLIAPRCCCFIVPQFKAIYADLGGTLPVADPHPDLGLGHVEEVLPDLRSSSADRVLLLPTLDQDRPGPGQVGRVQAARAGLRQADPQDRAGPILPHAGGADPLRRRHPRGARHRRRRRRATKSVSVALRDTQSAVKRGDTLARPLEQHEVFPPMVVQMIAVGEETGALDEMLDKIAGFYDTRSRRRSTP